MKIFLIYALETIQAYNKLASYLETPLRKNVAKYKSVSDDCMKFHLAMLDTFQEFSDLREENKIQVQDILFSLVALYKRATRLCFTRFCEFMDEESGLTVFSDTYRQLLNILESKQDIEILGRRLANLSDIIFLSDIPVCYYGFLIMQMEDLHDLFIGLIKETVNDE